ncbi:hypothetical protein CFP56_027278 [Quercus suber]|uniref:Uncharacterized protein n=1 Tax=Quercus suber TaxID=58331 RepID=A0AAW0JZ40_QUESU
MRSSFWRVFELLEDERMAMKFATRKWLLRKSLADENYGFLLANNSYTNYVFNSLTNHLPKLPHNPNSDFLNNKTFPQMEKHRQ